MLLLLLLLNITSCCEMLQVRFNVSISALQSCNSVQSKLIRVAAQIIRVTEQVPELFDVFHGGSERLDFAHLAVVAPCRDVLSQCVEAQIDLAYPVAFPLVPPDHRRRLGLLNAVMSNCCRQRWRRHYQSSPGSEVYFAFAAQRVSWGGLYWQDPTGCTVGHYASREH